MVRQHKSGCASEDVEQMQVMQWALLMTAAGGVYRKLDLLHHIPNGGRRGKAEAAIFKAMGVKAGVPDLFLPVMARAGALEKVYAGLYIEMKAKDGRLSAAQRKWLRELHEEGFACAVCFGAEEAEKALTDYLEGRFDQNEWAAWV